MPRFLEVLRCVGVDESSTPPGMVVPLGGHNLVALITDGKTLDVSAEGGAAKIKELPASDLVKLRDWLRQVFLLPGIDSSFLKAMTPLPYSSTPRMFSIEGKAMRGDPGIKLRAKSGTKVEASIEVQIRPRRTLRIAIRPVHVPGPDGKPKPHTTKPLDAAAEVSEMNWVWTPQTNIAFELVSEAPAFIDDRTDTVGTAIMQGFGLRDKANASFPPEFVEPSKLAELFKRYLAPNADLTIFVVDKIVTDTSRPSGNMQSVHGFGLLAGTHFSNTLAHEVGHFLGRKKKDGAWEGFHHTWHPDPNVDVTMLMREGGAGWKIPYTLVETFHRNFDKDGKFRA